MKMSIIMLAITMLFILNASCKRNTQSSELFSKDNLVAWCIVPYDNKERTPQERAEMLKDLGIKKFAYDWRTEHLADFEEELITLNQHDIELQAVWFWVDGGSEELIDDNNEYLLQKLEEHNVQTEIWVSFHDKYFEEITDEEKLEKAKLAIDHINNRVNEIGCTVALYNHGAWFGEPENQIRIIESLGKDNIKMVYNFHHAHQQIDAFPDLIRKMKPYLSTVNLNGMRVEGPKILGIGLGNREIEMLEALKDSGFQGHIGILGHIEEEDVKLVLERNLNGLQLVLEKIGEEEALKTY